MGDNSDSEPILILFTLNLSSLRPRLKALDPGIAPQWRPRTERLLVDERKARRVWWPFRYQRACLAQIHNCTLAAVAMDCLRLLLRLFWPANMSDTITADEFTSITTRQKQLNFENAKHTDVDQKILDGVNSREMS